MRARFWIGLLALVVAACSEDDPPTAPPVFDRPTRVAFACFDLTDEQNPLPIALEACSSTAEPDNDEDDDEEAPEVVPVLHALVVQSSRGEVAAVDLSTGRPLDSRKDIPGYTFLPVGELPTALVVPAREGNSRYTYVLSSGSRDITVLRTRAFRTLGAKEQSTLQTVMLPGESREVPVDMVLSPDEDALFVTVQNPGRLLRLPIQRCFTDSPEDCVDGSIDASGITEVSLAASVGLAMPPMSADPPASEPYAQMCSYEGPVSNRPIAVPPLSPDAATTTPKPSGLAVDSFCQVGMPCSRRLLVADEALPLVHVIDIDAWGRDASDAAVLPPIETGAPTRVVAVTPRVPVDLASDSGETQYVYAIDARDGSVLVTQDGRLLEVGSAGSRPDRITFSGSGTIPVALSLSVLTPAFDVHGPAAQYVHAGTKGMNDEGEYCFGADDERRSNARLRGVFLAVGGADGTVQIVDIHDMGLPVCRVCDAPKCNCGDSDDDCKEECDEAARIVDPYPLIRHRTRIGVTFDATTGESVSLAPVASPAFFIDDSTILVRETGATSDPRLRGLACVDCGERQVPAYPTSESAPAPDDDLDDGGVQDGSVQDGGMPDETMQDEDACGSNRARVCSLADPWGELDDWSAFYRGVIPGTRGGQGRFEQGDDGVTFRADGGLCGLGVLGADQLEGHAGDHVAILGKLPPDSAIRAAAPSDDKAFLADVIDACKALVAARDEGEPRQPIAFPILEAYDDALRIDGSLVQPREFRALRNDYEARFENQAAFVNTCFGNMLLAYEVRVGDGYAVIGRNVAGFLHRVRTEEGSGRCVIDPDRDPKRTGRAYEDERFDNGFVSFQILGGTTPPPVDTEFAPRLTSTTDKLALNTTSEQNGRVFASIPYDLQWSDENRVLYMIDVAGPALYPIGVDPFQLGRPIQ